MGNCCDVLMLGCDYSLGVAVVVVFGLIGVVALPEPLPVESEKTNKNLTLLSKTKKHKVLQNLSKDRDRNVNKKDMKSESETFNS